MTWGSMNQPLYKSCVYIHAHVVFLQEEPHFHQSQSDLKIQSLSSDAKWGEKRPRTQALKDRWGSRALQGIWRDAREWVCEALHKALDPTCCVHAGWVYRVVKLEGPFEDHPLQLLHSAYKVLASTYWWGRCGSKFTYQNSELRVVKHEPVWGFLIPTWYRIVVIQHEN